MTIPREVHEQTLHVRILSWMSSVVKAATELVMILARFHVPLETFSLLFLTFILIITFERDKRQMGLIIWSDNVYASSSIHNEMLDLVIGWERMYPTWYTNDKCIRNKISWVSRCFCARSDIRDSDCVSCKVNRQQYKRILMAWISISLEGDPAYSLLMCYSALFSCVIQDIVMIFFGKASAYIIRCEFSGHSAKLIKQQRKTKVNWLLVTERPICVASKNYRQMEPAMQNIRQKNVRKSKKRVVWTDEREEGDVLQQIVSTAEKRKIRWTKSKL